MLAINFRRLSLRNFYLHCGTRSSLGGVNMMPTAELLVVETTRSAACPKQLRTKRYRRERKTAYSLLARQISGSAGFVRQAARNCPLAVARPPTRHDFQAESLTERPRLGTSAPSPTVQLAGLISEALESDEQAAVRIQRAFRRLSTQRSKCIGSTVARPQPLTVYTQPEDEGDLDSKVDSFLFRKHIYRLRTPLTANDPD